MDYRPHKYTNQNGIKPSFKFLNKRVLWFNSDFHSGFVLINDKINEISFDTNPFEIYKFNKLKVLTYVRDSSQSKPIQIKLKLPLSQSREVYNTDMESYPIIYTNHTGVESITYNDNYSVKLIPQQIPRFTFRVDDNYNQFIGNSFVSSISNGEVLPVANASSFDKYIIFRNSGSFTLTDKMVVDILIIGGGGGGGRFMGGGGGAGGVVYQKNVILNSGSYSITVGAGGTGSTAVNGYTGSGIAGGNGGDSFIQLSGSDLVFNGITYRGKGGGGGGDYYSATGNGTGSGAGSNGGSGGGGNPYTSPITGGTANQGNTYFNGTTNVAGGYNGATGAGGSGSGGGGGAGSAGGVMNGGDGVQLSITGTPSWYAGGGGGSKIGTPNDLNDIKGGLGGSGVGGDGNASEGNIGDYNYIAPRHNGTDGTGSGGGGGAYAQNPDPNYGSGGGTGGSGVVIIRFTERKGRIEGITPEETLIQATNTNIPITIDSQYQINYQTPVVLPKGTYSATFANGGITFNGITDRSYPIIKDGSGVIINPLVWYQFDISNTLGFDSMGIHNLLNPNGVAYNSSDYTKGTGSSSFDGINDHLTKDNAFNLNSKNFSICFWIKKTDNSRLDRLFQLGTGLVANTTLYLSYQADNKIVFSNYSQDLITASAYTDAGSWVHLCFTYLTGVNKTAIIYRNGVNVAQMNFTNEFNTNNDIRIGSFSATNFYKGLMDDFRIYDGTTLSATQVAELYNGRLSIYNPPAFMLGVEIEDEKLSLINTISPNNRNDS